MQVQPIIRRLATAAALAAAGTMVAGCGTPKAKVRSPSSGSSKAASAEPRIKADWEAFFAAGTPVSKRVALLQNGQAFHSLIEAQSKSPLASEASAKVMNVSGVTSSSAQVTYSIVVAGTTALANQKGVAVYQGGTWKVGDKSFCTLLIMESGKKAKVPAACQSAT